MLTLLIDAHGVGYRAYHSTGSLDGGIAFGFLSTVVQLARKYKTNQFVFAWDGPGSLRKKLFPTYKESRNTKTLEEKVERAKIHAQFDALRTEILPAIGFTNNLFQPGYEADDLIASMVIDNPGRSFVVVSSDHDLYQLLKYHNCSTQHRLNGKDMTASQFMAEYGIPTRDWVAVKAMAGCSGDGVPGIPGVAEKTAVKYLLCELTKGKKYQAIISNFSTIKRNYSLVKLPFAGVVKTNLKKDSFDEEIMFQTFSDLGLSSFLSGDRRESWERFCRGDFVHG